MIPASWKEYGIVSKPVPIAAFLQSTKRCIQQVQGGDFMVDMDLRLTSSVNAELSRVPFPCFVELLISRGSFSSSSMSQTIPCKG